MKKCEDCKWSRPVNHNDGFVECHLNAPTPHTPTVLSDITDTPYGYPVVRWPVLRGSDFCAEFYPEKAGNHE